MLRGHRLMYPYTNVQALAQVQKQLQAPVNLQQHKQEIFTKFVDEQSANGVNFLLTFSCEPLLRFSSIDLNMMPKYTCLGVPPKHVDGQERTKAPYSSPPYRSSPPGSS